MNADANTIVHVCFLVYIFASVAWGVLAMKRFAFLNRRIDLACMAIDAALTRSVGRRKSPP